MFTDRIAAVVVVVGLLVGGSAMGEERCEEYSNIVGMVGLDSGTGTVYASVTEGSGSCDCTQIRFSSSKTDTGKALSILMAAKLAGKKIRFDLLDKDNCSSAYRVYMQ